MFSYPFSLKLFIHIIAFQDFMMKQKLDIAIYSGLRHNNVRAEEEKNEEEGHK